MAKTWTKHYLSEAMMKRLARMAAGRPSGAGNTLLALERRGMVVEAIDPYYPWVFDITDLGLEALADARREGW